MNVGGNSNALGVELSRGKKRPNVSSALAIVGQKSRGSSIEELQNSTGSSGAVCRPWDRNDLFRRLATFKSMTWFAKPEVPYLSLTPMTVFFLVFLMIA